MIRSAFYLFFLFLSISVFAQIDLQAEDSIKHINQYDKFNPISGGSSIRYCGKNKCNGNIIDRYENGNIKHKAYYTNGLLKNGYENYYENGQIERAFRAIDSNKGKLLMYYPNGQVCTEAIYNKKEVVLWKDYYHDGKIEYWEEYDKKINYLLVLDFYYSNGKPESTLRLIDNKKKIYEATEYYENGNIMEKGTKKHIPQNGGYIKEGEWHSYNENGELLKVERYYRGYVYEKD